MEQRTPVIYEFIRSKVERGDLNHFLGIYSLNRLPTGRRLRQMMNSMVFVVDGWNNDPREVQTIPELRKFYREFQQAWPFWFYFWNLHQDGLKPMVLSCLDKLVAVQSDDTPEKVFTHYDRVEFVQSLVANLGTMNVICERAKMFESLIYDRSKAIFEYFGLPYEGRSYRTSSQNLIDDFYILRLFLLARSIDSMHNAHDRRKVFVTHCYPISSITIWTRMSERGVFRLRVRSSTGAIAFKYMGHEDLKPRVMRANGENIIKCSVRFPEVVLWSCGPGPDRDKFKNPQQNGSIEAFDCSNNDITQIEFSGKLGLKALCCSFNGLRTIHLSSPLDQPSRNPLERLEHLDCCHNLLGHLNFTGLDSLRSLNCSHNKIKSLKLSGCINLRKLDCSHNCLRAIGLGRLHYLEKLDAQNNLFNSA